MTRSALYSVIIAVLHHDGAVGHFGELVVVGYDDEGLAQLFAQQKENLVQLLGILGVEVAAGLVGEDDFGAN